VELFRFESIYALNELKMKRYFTQKEILIHFAIQISKCRKQLLIKNTIGACKNSKQAWSQ